MKLIFTTTLYFVSIIILAQNTTPVTFFSNYRFKELQHYGIGINAYADSLLKPGIVRLTKATAIDDHKNKWEWESMLATTYDDNEDKEKNQFHAAFKVTPKQFIRKEVTISGELNYFTPTVENGGLIIIDKYDGTNGVNILKSYTTKTKLILLNSGSLYNLFTSDRHNFRKEVVKLASKNNLDKRKLKSLLQDYFEEYIDQNKTLGISDDGYNDKSLIFYSEGDYITGFKIRYDDQYRRTNSGRGLISKKLKYQILEFSYFKPKNDYRIELIIETEAAIKKYSFSTGVLQLKDFEPLGEIATD